MIRILFLIIWSNFLCSQNISRFTVTDSISGREVTRRFPSYTLQFKSPLEAGDYFNIGIVSDSLNKDSIGLRLYVYYPNYINISEVIEIRYENNAKDLLVPSGVADTNNYVEYEFMVNTFSINHFKPKTISFKGIMTYDFEDREYFINFMKQILYYAKD